MKLFKKIWKAIEDINQRMKPLEFEVIYTKEEFYEKFSTPQKFYSSPEWKRLRAKVFMRDNHICQICGDVGIIGHHINSAWYYPESALDSRNVMCACLDCHNKINKQNRERMDGND